MSCQNDIPATQSRKQCYPFDTAPSLRACSSTRTWHSRLYSSPSLPSYSSSSQADTDLLDPLDDITLDIDLDQRTASSATLLSRRVSSTLSTHQLSNEPSCSFSEYDLSTRLSASRQSSFLYPLHEPGQRTAQRTQRLRARTAAVIMSIPATCEDVIDADDEAAQVPASKLRRVPGVRDLRRAFYDGDDRPAHVAPISLEPSKASYEFGVLAPSTPPLSPLSPRSSLFTLVEVGNSLPHSVADAKTLCESTVSSRFTTKLCSAFTPSRILPEDTPQPILPRTYPVPNTSVARSRRHTSLTLDTCPSRPPGETVWSCAKISQSAAKRAVRRGHTPRRVFSHPTATHP